VPVGVSTVSSAVSEKSFVSCSKRKEHDSEPYDIPGVSRKICLASCHVASSLRNPNRSFPARKLRHTTLQLHARTMGDRTAQALAFHLISTKAQRL
jgi:hypothetical protein